MESRGKQKDIIRGAGQGQFCPLPHLESGRIKSINGLNFDPISRINTGVDVTGVVVPAMRPEKEPGRMALKKGKGVRSGEVSKRYCKRHTQGKSSG
jgi:hypothetical protein